MTEEERRIQRMRWNMRTATLQSMAPTRRILFGICVTVTIMFTACLGYVLHGWDWLDSFYMVIITIFGVGYGEVHPLDSVSLRWVTIGLIVLGYAAAVYTVGGLAQLVLDGELRRELGERRMQRQIEELTGHVVICGFGRMGTKLAATLAARGRSLIVIDEDSTSIEAARRQGCLGIQGNATEEEVLKRAGVERAATLATVLSDDVANLFITITAHELNPELEILARAEHSSSIKKLRQVGATQVVLPAAIGADRLAQMILRPSAESLMERAHFPIAMNTELELLGLQLDELEVLPGSSLVNAPVASCALTGDAPLIVLAVRHADGEVKLHPPATFLLAAGDCLIILARVNEVARLCNVFRLKSELPPKDASSSAVVE